MTLEERLNYLEKRVDYLERMVRDSGLALHIPIGPRPKTREEIEAEAQFVAEQVRKVMEDTQGPK